MATPSAPINDAADPDLLRFGDLLLDPLRFKAWRNGRTILLSALQVQLLTLMMKEPRHVFGRDELERILWPGRTLEIANLRTCFRRLRSSLNGPGEVELICNVRQQGYALSADVEAL